MIDNPYNNFFGGISVFIPPSPGNVEPFNPNKTSGIGHLSDIIIKVSELSLEQVPAGSSPTLKPITITRTSNDYYLILAYTCYEYDRHPTYRGVFSCNIYFVISPDTDPNNRVYTKFIYGEGGTLYESFIEDIFAIMPIQSTIVADIERPSIDRHTFYLTGVAFTTSEDAIIPYNQRYIDSFSEPPKGVAQPLAISEEWLITNGWGYIPPTSDNGLYPGPVDGGHVPYEFIRRGINYLRNIDIYDETYSAHANNAAFLKNKVGTLAYSGVEFAYPNIIVKAKTNLQFTHAVTASWSKNNRPVVYEVVNYHEIGNNLSEYTLRVDGLKTFFQYHTNKNPYVLRHTNSSNWNKWIKDSVPYNGKFSNLRATGTTLSRLYVVVVNAKYVYGFTESGFESFCDHILDSPKQAKIIPQISACYMCPINWDSQTLFDASGETIHFEPEAEITPAFPVQYKARGLFGTTTFDIPYTAGIVDDQAAIYDSHAVLHLPGYGDVNAPINYLVDYASEPSTSNAIRYRISLLDGTISTSVSPFFQWGPSISLPQISIPFNSEEVQMYNVNRNQQAGVSNMLTSAASGMAMGFMAGGGIGAIAGGIIGGASSLIGLNNTADAQRDIIANSQGIQSASCTGAASMADMTASLNLVKPLMNVTLTDYYDLVGYPVHKFLDDCLTTSGDTIWLAFNRASLDDKEEIVNDLLQKASEGIYWNP